MINTLQMTSTAIASPLAPILSSIDPIDFDDFDLSPVGMDDAVVSGASPPVGTNMINSAKMIPTIMISAQAPLLSSVTPVEFDEFDPMLQEIDNAVLVS